MRLSSMKLAGFKSFVDPTTIKFQTNLTSVVGPNGCGKSNIIDSIRWVIGESSAKNLRAESMADVIFNGTNKRKPVGQASVELIFDNEDGTLGGEYAGYREISVRRVLTRDGQSSYFLNNSRCRRKDVINIFLGTGLGPRSYSIIEQGMISKLIEAKPDELRIFIEEAAGISKYKERRRETENRIRHTRENLERLTDIRDELEKQLGKLKRQASAAERFKVLKQQQRELKAQVSAMQWKQLKDRDEELEYTLSEGATKLEAKIAELRQLDAKIEEQREIHIEETDAVNDVQKQYYSYGNEITKLEQQINNAKEREQQLRSDFEQATSSSSELEEQLVDDQQQMADVTADLENLENTSAEYREQAQASEQLLEQADEKMQQWRETWDDFQQHSSQVTREVEVEQTKINHLEQKLQTLAENIERRKSQLQEFDSSELEQQLEDDQGVLEELSEKINEVREFLNESNEKIREQRESSTIAQQRLNEHNSSLQKLHGRQSSLEALQQAALHKNDDSQTHWLEQNGLLDNPRLAEKIHVTAGWETAVETVVGSHLQAVCVDDFSLFSESLNRIADANMSFLKAEAPAATAQADTLVSKIQSELDLSALLTGIYTCDNLSEAMDIIANLEPHESVITQDGIWLSKHWIRIHKQADSQSGVLKRQQELEDILSEIQSLEQTINNEREQLSSAKERLHHLEEQRDQYQQDDRELSKQASELKSRLSANKAKAEQLTQRRDNINHELENSIEQQQQTTEQLLSAKAHLQEIEEKAYTQLERKEQLQEQKENLKEAVELARQESQHKKNKADEMQIRLQSSKNQLHYLQQGIDRASQQLEQLRDRQESITSQLQNISEPIPEWSESLEQFLSQRLEVETTLTEAKQKLNHIDAQLRENEKRRNEVDKAQQEIRESLEECKMNHQTLKVKCETLEEQLRESGFDRETLINNLDDNADLPQMQEEIEQCETKINRLGPINLAAIEECEQVQERKTYLDQQDSDLNEALETLENAIRKIDRETRTKFKETYEQVNQTFQDYFPKIFGGGNALLELTSEDLLEAGIVVKAQPPGKRNSTIHLLSGGEKALTAIALVFSMFQLNPAPFCILDEVDAPLDDANVVRYCNLVSAMSEKVQFIYISHNKIAIEMAKQLCGVTMQEAGVSRMVSVDIDQAMKMADEA